MAKNNNNDNTNSTNNPQQKASPPVGDASQSTRQNLLAGIQAGKKLNKTGEPTQKPQEEKPKGTWEVESIGNMIRQVQNKQETATKNNAVDSETGNSQNGLMKGEEAEKALSELLESFRLKSFDDETEFLKKKEVVQNRIKSIFKNIDRDDEDLGFIFEDLAEGEKNELEKIDNIIFIPKKTTETPIQPPEKEKSAETQEISEIPFAMPPKNEATPNPQEHSLDQLNPPSANLAHSITPNPKNGEPIQKTAEPKHPRMNESLLLQDIKQTKQNLRKTSKQEKSTQQKPVAGLPGLLENAMVNRRAFIKEDKDEEITPREIADNAISKMQSLCTDFENKIKNNEIISEATLNTEYSKCESQINRAFEKASKSCQDAYDDDKDEDEDYDWKKKQEYADLKDKKALFINNLINSKAQFLATQKAANTNSSESHEEQAPTIDTTPTAPLKQPPPPPPRKQPNSTGAPTIKPPPPSSPPPSSRSSSPTSFSELFEQLEPETPKASQKPTPPPPPPRDPKPVNPNSAIISDPDKYIKNFDSLGEQERERLYQLRDTLTATQKAAYLRTLQENAAYLTSAEASFLNQKPESTNHSNSAPPPPPPPPKPVESEVPKDTNQSPETVNKENQPDIEEALENFSELNQQERQDLFDQSGQLDDENLAAYLNVLDENSAILSDDERNRLQQHKDANYDPNTPPPLPNFPPPNDGDEEVTLPNFPPPPIPNNSQEKPPEPTTLPPPLPQPENTVDASRIHSLTEKTQALKEQLVDPQQERGPLAIYDLHQSMQKLKDEVRDLFKQPALKDSFPEEFNDARKTLIKAYRGYTSSITQALAKAPNNVGRDSNKQTMFQHLDFNEATTQLDQDPSLDELTKDDFGAIQKTLFTAFEKNIREQSIALERNSSSTVNDLGHLIKQGRIIANAMEDKQLETVIGKYQTEHPNEKSCLEILDESRQLYHQQLDKLYQGPTNTQTNIEIKNTLKQEEQWFKATKIHPSFRNSSKTQEYIGKRLHDLQGHQDHIKVKDILRHERLDNDSASTLKTFRQTHPTLLSPQEDTTIKTKLEKYTNKQKAAAKANDHAPLANEQTVKPSKSVQQQSNGLDKLTMRANFDNLHKNKRSYKDYLREINSLLSKIKTEGPTKANTELSETYDKENFEKVQDDLQQAYVKNVTAQYTLMTENPTPTPDQLLELGKLIELHREIHCALSENKKPEITCAGQTLTTGQAFTQIRGYYHQQLVSQYDHASPEKKQQLQSALEQEKVWYQALNSQPDYKGKEGTINKIIDKIDKGLRQIERKEHPNLLTRITTWVLSWFRSAPANTKATPAHATTNQVRLNESNSGHSPLSSEGLVDTEKPKPEVDPDKAVGNKGGSITHTVTKQQENHRTDQGPTPDTDGPRPDTNNNPTGRIFVQDKTASCRSRTGIART